MAGSLNLGELYAKLSVDYSDLHLAALKSAATGEKIRGDFDKIAKAGEQLKGVGSKMSAFITAPLVGAAGASIKFSQDFDKAIREVNSLLDAGDKDFAGLKDQIRGVATTLGLDVVEAANAAYEAIGAGVPKDNLVDFLNVAGKAAIGGVTTMKTVVDGLTTVTNAWGDSAGDAQQIADEMFTAVKYGKVTFEQMAASMSTVGALGPELGVSFKEVAAASAVMTAQGVPQSVAMTQMRGAMSALVTPNEEMTKLFKAAGIESVKTTIKQKGLAGTYDILRKAADKNKISIEKSVGSVDALGFVLKTTGANGEKFNTAMEQVANAGGSLEAAFQEMDKARALDKLLNNLKALGTVIGDMLLPIINPFIEQITEWVKQAQTLDPELQKWAVILGAVAAAIGPVLFAVGSMVAAIAPAIGAAGGLSAALGSMVAMAGPVGLAIAAIVAAGVLLYKHWDEVKAFVVGLVNSVIGWFNKWVSDNAGLIEEIKAAWNDFVASGSALFNTLWGIISKFVQDSIASLDELLEPIGGIKGAWELLKTAIGDALTAAGEFLRDFLKGAKIIFDELNLALQTGDWSFFSELVHEMVKQVTKYLLELPAKFKEIFNQIVDYLKSIDWKQIGTDMMTGLRDGIWNMGASVVDAAKGAANNVTSAVKEAWDEHSPSRVFMQLGAWAMEGLSIGISQNANSAVAAVIAASDSVLNAAKGKLSAEEMRKNLTAGVMDINKELTLNPTFAQGLGGEMSKYDLEIEKEKAYYAQSLELLKQAEAAKIESIRPYAELREQMEKQHQLKLQSFEQQRLESQLNAVSGFFGNLAKLQNSENKKMATIGKAAAIAQATIDTYKAATGAYAAMASIPYVGPALGVAAAAAAVAAGMANVSAIRGQKAYNAGGHIPSGQIGLVGETGRPELVAGPANVLSSQNTHELLNSGGKGSGNVSIEVYNYEGRNVEIEQGGDDEEKKIRIYIDRMKAELVKDARRGDGPVDSAYAQIFKLNRSA